MRRSLLIFLISLFVWNGNIRAEETKQQIYCVRAGIAADAVRVYATTNPGSLGRLKWLFWEGNIFYCFHMESIFLAELVGFIDIFYDGDDTYGYIPFQYLDGEIRYIIGVVNSRGS